MCIRDRQNIYDALKRLRNRDIETNNEKMWLSIGFVNYVKHIKNKSYFEVQVSKEVLPYYVEPVSYTHLDVYKRQVLLQEKKEESFKSKNA